MESATTFKSKQPIICGALGLACMFGGIWLGDTQFSSFIASGNTILVMRLFTLFIYVVTCVVCFLFAKRDSARLAPFFGVGCLVGLICFVIGALLVYGPVPFAEQNRAVAWIALFLTKIIGAPLSIGLVCVFALMGRRFSIRMSLVGMLGAFLLYSVFELGVDNALFGSGIAVLIGFFLLCLACMLGMFGMNSSPEGRKYEPKFSAITAGVVKRPWRKVLTPGFILMVIFSAMMLGLLRNGGQISDPHKDPVAIAVFAVFVIVSLLWKGLRVEHLFYTALICSAAGFLLAPIYNPLVPEMAPILYGIGMALFEVVTWTLVVWAARNCILTLMSAAVSRFLVTFGHFLGTLIFSLGLAFSGYSHQEVFQDCALFLMFIYIILLVILLKFPDLQAPFMSTTYVTGYSEAPLPPVDEVKNSGFREEQQAQDSVQEPDGEQDREQGQEPELGQESMTSIDFRYWQLPCDTIAETYKLTAREREVLELLARGRNLATMQEKLVISGNTLKMHIRHIYTKLDIHSKQDVINMVEQLRLEEDPVEKD